MIYKKKVYFIGGAKGVGKSKVLEEIGKETGLDVLNTGDFFHQMNASKNVVTSEIVNSLIKNSPVIADTHYAGYLEDIYSGKFERGLSVEELFSLNNAIDLSFILIDLDSKTLIKRRTKDKRNSRDLKFENLNVELIANRQYFHEYCLQLNKLGIIIPNYELSNTRSILMNIILGNEN